MQPRSKQIIIVLAYFLIFASIAFGVYFLYLRPEPTCSDGKKNQDEEQIDCGGLCPSCELRTLQDLKVLWVKALETTGQNYDLVARIQNSNQNYGTGSFQYEFKLYDLNDQLIVSRKGLSFILPREKKYITVIKVPVDRSVAKIALEIDQNIAWEKIPNYQAPEVGVFDKKYEVLREDTIFARASGRIKNTGHFSYPTVELVTVLFAGENEPVAVNRTTINSLSAGQERYFSAPWLFEVVGAVSLIDIEPQINLYTYERGE